MPSPAHPLPSSSVTIPSVPLGTIPARPRVPGAPELPGYEIVRELGSGGMGVVYLARQPELDREVALKLLRDGSLAHDDARTRFAEEARAAARLRHPNIVQLYEFGTAYDLPYVAMEFVDGPTLACHLSGQPQPVAWSAALVEQVARAMQYAHEQGVIHRDLKPANIFLAEDRGQRTEDREKPGTGRSELSSVLCPLSSPSAKVGDFGLAKIVGESAVETETGYASGTPGYMAPEQVRGDRELIGPWTDVYALGVILYECVVGKRPFGDWSPPAVMMATTTMDPTPPRKVRPDVPRDLETICLKCLAKKPEERYLTAAALAADLRRFLDGRPILARRAGPAERVWKFVRRNPVVSGLAVALVASLVAGFATASVLYVRAEDRRVQAEDAREAAERAAAKEAEARSAAERSAAEARKAEADARKAEQTVAEALAELTGRQTDLEAVNSFLLEDILAAPRPPGYDRAGRGAVVTIREALDSAAGRVDLRFKDTPRLAAAVEHVLGESYRQIGEHAPAAKHLTRAVELREQYTPNDHAGLARSRRSLALALSVGGKQTEAIALFRQVLTDLAGRPDEKFEALVRRDLGLCLNVTGDTTGALEMLTVSLSLHERLYGPDHAQTLAVLNGVASVYLKAGRYDTAAAIARDSAARAEKVHGADHLLVAYALGLLGSALGHTDPPSAEEPLRRATELHARLVGPTHPETITMTATLGAVLVKLKKYEDAAGVLRPAAAAAPAALGAGHTVTFMIRNDLAQSLAFLGKWDEAEAVMEAMVEAHRRYRPAELKAAEAALATIRKMKARQGQVPVAPPPRPAAQEEDKAMARG